MTPVVNVPSRVTCGKCPLEGEIDQRLLPHNTLICRHMEDGRDEAPLLDNARDFEHCVAVRQAHTRPVLLFASHGVRALDEVPCLVHMQGRQCPLREVVREAEAATGQEHV